MAFLNTMDRGVRRWASASDAAFEPVAAERAFELREPLRSLAVFAGSPTPYGGKVDPLTVILCNADGGAQGGPIAPMDEVRQAIPHRILRREDVQDPAVLVIDRFVVVDEIVPDRKRSWRELNGEDRALVDPGAFVATVTEVAHDLNDGSLVGTEV
jgi:hypothetical protein